MYKSIKISKIAKKYMVSIDVIKDILQSNGVNVPNNSYKLSEDEISIIDLALSRPKTETSESATEYCSSEETILSAEGDDITPDYSVFIISSSSILLLPWSNPKLLSKGCGILRLPTDREIENYKTTLVNRISNDNFTCFKDHAKNDFRSIFDSFYLQGDRNGKERVFGTECHKKCSDFIFDIVNNRYSSVVQNEDGNYSLETNIPMDMYADWGIGGYKKCHSKGIYNTKLLSSFHAFTSQNKDIITKTIGSVIDSMAVDKGSMNKNDDGDVLCLMPDFISDFDKSVKPQLKYNGRQIFPIPRSIMAAYTYEMEWYDNEFKTMPYSFLCIDYDGLEISAINIKVEQLPNNRIVFIRSGLENIGDSAVSYTRLAEEYIDSFCQKKNYKISRRTRDNLVDTKDIFKVIYDRQPILVYEDGMSFWLTYDEKLVKLLVDKIKESADYIANGRNKLIMCSFFDDPQFYCFKRFVNKGGYEELWKRYRAHDFSEPLWEEDLPELSLEINKNKMHNILELISSEDRRQSIVGGSYLNEEVKIPVADSLTIPAGEKVISLPLIRTLFGQFDEPLNAEFRLDKPFDHDVEVNLFVKYKYGDENSLVLIAEPISPIENISEIKSEWVSANKVLDNPVPHFVQTKHHAVKKKRVYEKYKNIFRSLYYDCDESYFDNSPENIHKIEINGQIQPISRLFFPLLKHQNSRFILKEYFSSSLYKECPEYCETLLNSETLEVFNDILTNNFIFKVNKKVLRLAQRDVRTICAEFGYMYHVDSPGMAELIASLKNNPDATLWITATREVPLDQDNLYDIWKTMASKIENGLKSGNGQLHLEILRSLSSVAWVNEKWIFDFYDVVNNRVAIDDLCDCIFEQTKHIYNKKISNGEILNPRGLRDILELLLALCRLREIEPNILDSNSQKVKDFVKLLKDINRGVYGLEEIDNLKYKFNTHLGITVPKEYENVYAIIYSLIKTLTGDEAVLLQGFDDSIS